MNLEEKKNNEWEIANNSLHFVWSTHEDLYLRNERGNRD